MDSRPPGSAGGNKLWTGTLSATTGPGFAADLPRSAQRLLALLSDGPLTHRDLVARSGLPPRTVRHALLHLHRRGLVVARQSLRDARQRLHFAVAAPRENNAVL